MRPTTRRTGAFALLAALVAVPTGLPAAAQSSAPTQITQRHSILTELGSTGDVSSSRVFTQLTVAGDGDTTVTLPAQSTRGLRSLDGFGGPEVNGDDVVWNVRATRDGTRGRTVADNTAELPVDVQVRYTLDGRDVEPSEIVGQSGRLAVTYTVTNTTAEPVEIHPSDARGDRVTEEIDVAVPMVGSLALTLPPTFTNVDARGANVAGDGRGNTVVNFSLLLFSPLGDETQEVTYHANVTDAAVPGARIQVLPVDESSFTSLRSTSLAYRDAVDGTQRLGYGAQLIDTNVLKLADGAAQLLDGLSQLSDGADQLSDGLVNAAAPGARELADGLSGRAAPGARELADGLQGQAAPGARQLSEGLGSARAGGGQLALGLSDLSSGASRLRDGAGDLAAGASQLDAGAGRLAAGASDLADGGAALQAGVRDLRAGVLGEDGLFDAVLGGIEQVRGGAVPLLQRGSDPQNPTLLDGLTALAGTSRTATAAPTGLQAAAEGAGALAQINAGLYSAYQEGRAGLEAAVNGTRDTDRGAACLATQSCTIGDVLSILNADAAVGALPIPGTQVPYGAVLPNTVAGLEQVHDGLSDSLDGLGPDAFGPLPAALAECDAALAAVQGEDPTGLQSLLAATCISRSLNTGLNGDGTATNPGAANAANRLRDGARDLGIGLDQGLDTFAGQVRAGRTELNAAFGTDRTDGTLLNGVARIAGGAGELAEGAGDLRSQGTSALAAGASQLSDGSRDLAAGASRAASGGGDLADGLRQLDDGAVALAAGIGTAATGAGELADGIGDAADGATQLADGLGDAADGSGQLADGLRQAEDGGEQIADGSVRLSEEGMGALIDGISDAKLGASRNLEAIKAVSNRGRSFDGPYGTAARADSSTVWQFEVAGVGDVDGTPSTTTVALLALAALGVAGGAGTFLRRRLV